MEREIAGGSTESRGEGMPSRAKEWALLGLGEGGPVVHGASG